MEELKSAISENHAAGRSQIPWLIFPISPIERRSDTFYVLEKNTRYGMLNFTEPNKIHVLDLPEDQIAPGHCCVGVYGTWMLMCFDSTTIFLLNPFTSKRVDLPHQNICIPKVSQFVVSEHMVVMAIYGDKKRISYCRPDDERWTAIRYDGDHYVGLFYLDDQFLALDERKGVLLMNYDGSAMTTTRLKFPVGKPVDDYYERRWGRHVTRSLVCWSEKVLTVEWNLNNDDKTEVEGVWELDTSFGEWRMVDDLGDYALFVGKNYSCALPCSSEGGGYWKKNCVYYADHWKKEDVVFHEIKMRDLGDGTTQHLCYGRGVIDIGTQFLAGSGGWIVPSLS